MLPLPALLLFAVLQPPADSLATVRGRITDAISSAPIEQVAIAIAGTRFGTQTDTAGQFVLRIPAGAVTLTASRIGYATRSERLTLEAGEQRTVNLTLATSTTELRAVRVESQTTEREQFALSPNPGLFAVRGETLKRVPVIGEPDVLRVV